METTRDSEYTWAKTIANSGGDGTPVKCDCGCGQLMAIEYDDRIVVKTKHHGSYHTATSPKQDMIEAYVTEDEKKALALKFGSSSN